jgi:hypothetical protein
MKISRFAIAVVVTLALAVAAVPAFTSGVVHRLDHEDAGVVFVCKNGVAMSVWSALYFNQLAARRGLSARAGAGATERTFTEVPLKMRLALALDGYGIGGYEPRVIGAADARRAERVIVIDTELPPSAASGAATVERWSGFPPMREQYFPSRAALRTRVEELVERLARR